MRVLLLLSLLSLCGCDQLANAPEKPAGHLIQIVDYQQNVLNAPDYWIIRDSRNGVEYLVVGGSNGSVAIIELRGHP